LPREKFAAMLQPVRQEQNTQAALELFEDLTTEWSQPSRTAPAVLNMYDMQRRVRLLEGFETILRVGDAAVTCSHAVCSPADDEGVKSFDIAVANVEDSHFTLRVKRYSPTHFMASFFRKEGDGVRAREFLEGTPVKVDANVHFNRKEVDRAEDVLTLAWLALRNPSLHDPAMTERASREYQNLYPGTEPTFL